MTAITVSDPEFLAWLRDSGINITSLDPDSQEMLYDVYLAEEDEDYYDFYDDGW